MKYTTQTKCVHGEKKLSTQGAGKTLEHKGAISFPIYQTATFAHPGVGQSTGYDYSRTQNPTRAHLEEVVASLEKAYDAIAFSSGMAAITATMELFAPGDHIIASEDLYGGSIRLFEAINRKNHYAIEYVDTSVLDSVKKAITPQTKAIYIETPTNPMMHVTDIEAISSIAKEHHLLLIVDNTFCTPYFQNPICLGADIVLHSGTKFLSGHNDTLGGFAVTKTKELSEKIRYILKTVGSGLAPFDSWLMLRGIKTLALRMEKSQENACTLSHWLLSHPKVKAVHYVGLENHPGYEVCKKQATGFGSMVSFHVDTADTAKNLLERISLIQYAESLGGVESLMTYPMLQTHADVPYEERIRKGIDDTLIRLSVGIENIEDLLIDLKNALG